MADVLILGGGLAGLAAASKLADAGIPTKILESKNRLGGRASSFTDARTGQVIDACQHVSMGCCTEFTEFMNRIGIQDQLRREKTLYFMTPDRKVTRFAGSFLPAPFHLGSSFARLHYLSWSEKLRLVRGLLSLMRTNPDEDGPLLPWLIEHGQTENLLKRFWSVVLISALNESLDHVGRKYARKVFLDGFIKGRHSYEVYLPKGPLAELYGQAMQSWLSERGTSIQFDSSVYRFEMEEDRIKQVHLRDGRSESAKWIISALPHSRLLDLLPESRIQAEPVFSRLKEFEVSPITSVHLWYDRPVLDLPHVVLIDCLGHWVFKRQEAEPIPGEYYIQVVVSASTDLKKLGQDEILKQIAEEISQLFPKAMQAKLLRSRVITEHSATFRPVPGIDHLRPETISPIPGLLLAGDWTATGWPATMEGAVRSGHRAAEVILKQKI
jgi:squalene-associated FAD-dependent desaturase